MRTPIYFCDLDSDKLRPVAANTYYYDEVTVDPRFEAIEPESPGASREADQ